MFAHEKTRSVVLFTTARETVVMGSTLRMVGLHDKIQFGFVCSSQPLVHCVFVQPTRVTLYVARREFGNNQYLPSRCRLCRCYVAPSQNWASRMFGLHRRPTHYGYRRGLLPLTSLYFIVAMTAPLLPSPSICCQYVLHVFVQGSGRIFFSPGAASGLANVLGAAGLEAGRGSARAP